MRVRRRRALSGHPRSRLSISLLRMDRRPRRYCSCGLFSRVRSRRGYRAVRSGRRGGRTCLCRRGSLGLRCRWAGGLVGYSGYGGWRTVLCEAARQRCHSKWAKVTGCEKGRSLSRSAVYELAIVALSVGVLTFNGVLVVWPDIEGVCDLAKGQERIEFHVGSC